MKGKKVFGNNDKNKRGYINQHHWFDLRFVLTIPRQYY